jgi:hypothetical protein
MPYAAVVPEFQAEPYLHLAGLSHKSALVSWGAFYFKTAATYRARHRGEQVSGPIVLTL